MKKITRIDLSDVFQYDRIKYNINNVWPNNSQPLDYDYIYNQTSTRYWIDKFHKDEYFTITLDKYDLKWMTEAFKSGCITKRFPKSYLESLETLKSKYNHLIKENDKGYFVRTEKASMKYGCHGIGPYYNIETIVESMVTTLANHRCFNVEDNTCTIYFIKWNNLDSDKEFRIFVYNNQITAISAQHLYQINDYLNSLSDEQIYTIIHDIIKYFNANIKDKLVEIGSYVMDFYYDPINPYFIEINPFGFEYSSGSALFGLEDKDLLYGLCNYIELRFCSHDTSTIIRTN